MSISRTVKPKEELQEHQVARAVRAYVTVQAQNWREEQINAVLPRVMIKIDEARAMNNAPDVGKIIKQVFIERDLAGLLE